jgi:hypothetical protein
MADAAGDLADMKTTLLSSMVVPPSSIASSFWQNATSCDTLPGRSSSTLGCSAMGQSMMVAGDG